MTTELRCLVWAAALGLLHLLLAAGATRMQRNDLAWAAGSRDTPQPPPTGVAGRLQRAQANFLETFPLFVAVLLAAQLGGRTGGAAALGAQVYLWARVIYLPLYAAGVPWLRSLVWGASVVGIAMVLFAALG
ncbi:MAPEG family protein [Roseomonas sp. OT10]|uniref:MAPEG family protein n=1 Tax=Roseomonas cutis TaxID=2897332 RepID=UPI001E2CE1F2|nr:MAPEG family protein [Roseomonas sp. OT10]UFN51186.1 MAPEG family protein [Roseomonas sp. OT10]